MRLSKGEKVYAKYHTYKRDLLAKEETRQAIRKEYNSLLSENRSILEKEPFPYQVNKDKNLYDYFYFCVKQPYNLNYRLIELKDTLEKIKRGLHA